MKKEQLLHHCKYYKGDEKDIVNPEERTIANIEKEWVELTANEDRNTPNHMTDALEEYLLVGLGDFEKFDDTPLTLKALLFNRFIKYNEQFDIDAFKKWYKKWMA